MRHQPVATDPLAWAIERLAEDIRHAPQRAWEAEAEAERIGFSAVHLRRLLLPALRHAVPSLSRPGADASSRPACCEEPI